MRRSLFRATLLAMALLQVAACAHDAPPAAAQDTGTPLSPALPPPDLVVDAPAGPVPADAAPATPMACREPRPQMCTADYRPVCATRDTGVRCVTTPCPSSERKTYSNACAACSDAAVSDYVEGECPASSPGSS